MKRILAYGGHLLVATLAVPWLTMMAAGLVHGVFSPFSPLSTRRSSSILTM